MVYKLMKRIIENGIKNKNLDTVDIQTKLDVYFAYDKITQEQYEELSTMVSSYTA